MVAYNICNYNVPVNIFTEYNLCGCLFYFISYSVHLSVLIKHTVAALQAFMKLSL